MKLPYLNKTKPVPLEIFKQNPKESFQLIATVTNQVFEYRAPNFGENQARIFKREQFLEGLCDGCVVYIDSGLVKDALTYVTERGARSHELYKVPRTQQDLFEVRDAIAEWARLSSEILWRAPDYKAAIVETLACDVDLYSGYGRNMRRWYEKIAGEAMFVNPAGDRSKPPAEQHHVYVDVVKERDDGVVVRGARLVSTGACLHQCHLYGLVYPAHRVG